MAGDTNSNIFINIDTSQAMTQLRLLEKELTALNRSLIVGTKTASAAQAKYAQSLLHNVNATGQWTASMTRMSTASEQFANKLDRQGLSLKEYFRYGAASTKTFGKMFRGEFDTIGKLVEKRVKTLQQQYVQLGRDAQGAMNAMKFTPKALNYRNVTTQLMAATQRQQIFNKLVDDGSTKLLNFGKNTQWAGRQLMVGFTIPLMLFGTQAIKTFKEIETQVIRFKKVYGEIFTDQGATFVALKNIRALGDEYTKYGLKVADTIKMAADAAAAGFSGKGLEVLVEQTNKLAVLGGVTQEKALETTIALRNAFQIDSGAMAGTIDFLNAVENQTVVALDDLTEAIPKVAPVIQQLGGDVKDLAYFMAAMQEGGISAAQGANALKSGLASLINPSNAASKAAAAVGINIKGIVEANQGNLRNTVTGFAKALQPLTDLEKSRVIEKVFGKYQFARISALLNNIGREGTQAARVLQLTNASVEELAILSQRELKIQADSPMNKFVGSVERLKASIAPIGELFAKVLTPVIEFISRMAEKFNKLPDGIKKAIGIITIVVAGLGPLFLMTFGLLANAVANSVKGIQVLRKGYQQLSAGSSDAALKTQYLTQEELENISISNALYSKHQQLSAAYQLEAAALTSLTSVYKGASIAMGGFAAQNPGMFMPGRGGMPRRFAHGTTSVPGPTGAGDVVPAMLSPGESVIPTKQTEKYSGFISQIIQDKVPGFISGRLGALEWGAAAKFGRGIPLSAGPAAFREAQQARYAARDAARRGLSSNVAPVISIPSGLRRPGLSGIRFTEEPGGLVTVTAGLQSFKIKKEDVPKLKNLLTENQTWLESQGRLPGGSFSATKGYADTTEGKLEHAIRTRLQKKIAARGGVLTPALVNSKLQKYDASKTRPVAKEVKSLRARYKNSPIYKELVATHKKEVEDLKLIARTNPNPYGLTEEELMTVQGAQGNRAKEFKYSPALSHRFTDRQVYELSSLNQYKRNAPSNVFEEQSFLNKYFQDIAKTSAGGMHISRKDQAQAALKMILDKPLSQRSAVEKTVHATLDKRVSSGYYEKFGAKTNQLSLLKDAGLTNAQIRELPRTGVPGFAGGVVSLGMPIAFKTVAANRAMAQQIDARVRSSSFRHTPPTNFGVKLEEFTGHSFPIPGIGGVYRKPNGQVVVVKPVLNEKAALAEQRGTKITRGAFKDLDAPEQTIRTMIDPTDLTGKRKIIVLESPYNAKFATGGTKFSKEEYFTQLLASTVRGDKDLSSSNVFGSNVADQGASGVFGKASGAREFNFKMPSLEEQAMINLLGVKGGARKAFAENTADIARSMTPAQYQKAMLTEIDATIPRLEKTIASFGLTTGIEKIVYQRMIDRLIAARGVNWGKFQEVHSRVKAPLKLAEGIVSVPGPKGAGDIQPAMLSPGEAVIPAEQSAKYMPLIQSMIADKVPGFAGPDVGGFGVAASIRPGGKYYSLGDPVKETPAAGTRSPDRVERAIDKFFDKPRVKKLGDRIDNFAAKVRTATPKVADLGKTVDKTTESFGKDKTRGFRGFIAGYGNVKNTVTDAGGATRAATAAERTNMRQANRMNFTQKMMPVQMLAMMAPMAAQGYATKNPDSGIAKNMDAIMMLSMLVMLLPMLNSPILLLIASTVGLVALFKMQAATIKKNIIEGQKQAESMTMTTKQLEELGNITHRVSFTQTAAKKRAGRNTDIVPVSIEFGNNILANEDFGKNLKTSFEKTLANPNLGQGAAVDSLVNQLGTAVSQGVLDRGQAESIAVALTRNLKDAKLELDVRGRLIELLGPNGENLVNNPLQVQVDLINSGKRLQDAALENLNKITKQERGINTKTEVGQLAAGGVAGAGIGLRAGYQVANIMTDLPAARAMGGGIPTALKAVQAARMAGMVASGGAAATGVGAPLGAAGAVVTTVITGAIEAAIRNWQKGKEKKAIGEAAGMLQGLVSQNVAAAQASIDVLTSQYDSAIANLEIKKKTLKTEQERKEIDDQIAGLETKKASGLKDLRKQSADILNVASSNLDKVAGSSTFEKISPFGSGRGAIKDKYMESFKVGMEEKFKDNVALKAQAIGLQSQLKSLDFRKIDPAAVGSRDANDLRDKFTLEVSTLVTSDTLSPAEASALVSTLTQTGGDLSKKLKTLVSVQGPEGVQRLSTILTMLPNEDNRRNLFVAVQQMDKTQSDEVMSSIEELAKIPGFVGIELDIETQKEDLERLKRVGKEIAALNKAFPDGKITKTALIKVQKEAGGPGENLTLDAAIRDWTALSKLPKDLQFQAMITMGSIEFSDSFEGILSRELDAEFLKQNPKVAGQAPPGVAGSANVKARADAMAAFKKDPKNREAATKAAFDKIRTQLFGTAPVDNSKGGGKTGTTGDGAKIDLSWLDDLVQRLKLNKEQGLNPSKALESLKKYLDLEGKKSANPDLDKQQGLLKNIEAISKAPKGIPLAENLVNLLKQLDAEQFKLVYNYLFNINGTLNDTGKIINEAFRVDTLASFLQKQKDLNKDLEGQTTTFNKLIKLGYSMEDVLLILQDETLALDIANGNAYSTEELKQYNDELKKTVDLKVLESAQSKLKQLPELQKQAEVLAKLTGAGYSYADALKILSDKALVAKIALEPDPANFKGLVDSALDFAKILEVIQEMNKTPQQRVQEEISRAVESLDLQAKDLQNKFDTDPKIIQFQAAILLSQNTIDLLNNDIQKEQDKIDAINVTLKYDKKIGQNLIDYIQETLSDLERKIDLEYDRPIQALSERSNILSNDLTLIDKASEAINEKYDKQEEALNKILELNQDIAAQEKSRISLADALSQGDISAAAQAASEMRSSAADAANRRSGDFLATAKKNEIDGLISGTGMTRKAIEAEQFAIGQKTFLLEQESKKLKESAVLIEDRLYDIQELREIKLLEIRDIETNIDFIKNGALLTEEVALRNNNILLNAKQVLLDAALLNINQQKLAYETTEIALGKWNQAQDILNKGPLQSAKDLSSAIASDFKAIIDAVSKDIIVKIKAVYEGFKSFAGNNASGTYVTACPPGSKMNDKGECVKTDITCPPGSKMNDKGECVKIAVADIVITPENVADVAAAEAADAAAALADANAILGKGSGNDYSGDDGIAKRAAAAMQAAAEAAKAAAAAVAEAAKAAAAAKAERIANKIGYGSSGGMVPKYFSVGGMSRGTDIIPAMLTPGEFVMSKYAVDSYGVDKMKAINSGYNNSESVYNYNLNLNVKSDSNPQDIARVVMTQIKLVDSQRIRTQG